ncbi:hypothetical protein LR48_Vigan10g051400 [Vigna angularis]|uniref:Uncharacterized protein n=1 Tax=Phaseolus angularis TaxID=3914 RepID=A0A0L9VIA0_PHAAN|nr:hypothetical protein LR48_Vigan10g051400 [Vigna angularis]
MVPRPFPQPINLETLEQQSAALVHLNTVTLQSLEVARANFEATQRQLMEIIGITRDIIRTEECNGIGIAQGATTTDNKRSHIFKEQIQERHLMIVPYHLLFQLLGVKSIRYSLWEERTLKTWFGADREQGSLDGLEKFSSRLWWSKGELRRGSSGSECERHGLRDLSFVLVIVDEDRNGEQVQQPRRLHNYPAIFFK